MPTPQNLPSTRRMRHTTKVVEMGYLFDSNVKIILKSRQRRGLAQYLSEAVYLRAIKNPLLSGGGFWHRLVRIRSLTMTYFRRRGAYYHWRGSVS
ncbi:MAG: hypothetical protein ACYC0Z_13825, partial [Acidobacteriaceae bacterium]